MGYRSEVRVGRLEPGIFGAGRRFRLSDGTLTRFDEFLQVDGSRRVALGDAARLLAATDDLGQFVAADEDLVFIVGDEVRALDVAGADSAVLLEDGRLLVSAPSADVLRQHEVLLIDSTSASVLDRATLDVYPDGMTPLIHPSDGSVLLDAAESEDGSRIFVVRPRDGRLEVEVVHQDMVAADFNPSGSRLLFTPHPSLDDEVMVFDWPAMTLRDQLTGEQPGRVEDDEDVVFDMYGCFLGEDRILLKTYTDGVLVCEDDLRRRTPLDLSAAPGMSGAEVVALYGLSPTTFAVDQAGNASAPSNAG